MVADEEWGATGRAIDVHSHLVPPAYAIAIAEEAARSEVFHDLAVRNRLLPDAGADGPATALVSADSRIEEMDHAGIAVSAISVPPPGPTLGPKARAISSTKATNDGLIAVAEQHPSRFRVLVSLPLPYVEDALAEIERVSSHPLVRGVVLMTVGADWTLDEAQFEPVYQSLAEHQMVGSLHPALEAVGPAFNDFDLSASVAPVLSSTIGALRLALSGMLDRVPEFDVIVPHLGGVIPYLMQRVVDLSGSARAAHSIEHYLAERFYLDTCSFHPPALECALKTTPATRLLLGSDAPFRGPAARAVEDVRTSGLTPREQTAVLGATAANWFA
jgi:aminocarboxymuconate-semialdehyde decarboxylase